MEKKETTSTLPETPNTIQEGLRSLGCRLSIVQEGKDSILNLLNTLEENRKILKKISNNEIITKKEHQSITAYTHICAYQSRPVDILNIIKPKNTADHNKTVREVCSYINNYPFVVDADEADENISRLLGEGITEIRKNGKRGLVKKAKGPDGEDEILPLFDHNNSGRGVLTFSQEEYEKYGLIKVMHQERMSQDPYQVMFLQKVEDTENGGIKRFENIGRFRMLQGFDKDSIGFAFEGGSYYKLIHRDISPQGIRIYEIGESFLSDRDTIKKGFNDFNTFEAETKKLGKVAFKKKYDPSGNLTGIYAFRKKRFGGEEQVRARDKKENIG